METDAYQGDEHETVGDITIPHITSLYARVPADRLGAFQAFRRDFSYQDVTHDGVTWPYLTGGRGDPPLLLLSGALAIPDISWITIANLVAQRRVIGPAYPTV